MGHDDESSALLKNELECRDCATDTGIVRDLTFLDRNVEIDPDNGLLATEVVVFNTVLHIVNELSCFNPTCKVRIFCNYTKEYGLPIQQPAGNASTEHAGRNMDGISRP